MPAGGGDPHLITTANKRFEFRGVPGEVYKLLQCHNLGLSATVREIGTGAQVIDRLIVHLPGDISIVVTPAIVAIDTPEHHLDIKQDSGHLVDEGEVRPDPLKGDAPHLDFGHTPKIGLAHEFTSGLLYDGNTRKFPDDEMAYRTGHFWSEDAEF